MNTYLYSGPTTGITFRGEAGKNVEVMLFSGKEVSLPDCAEVSTLVALKRLQPVKSAVAPTPAQSAPTTASTTGAAESASPAPAAQDASSSSASSAAPATQKKGA